MTVVEQVDSVLTLEEAQHLVDRMTQHVAILDSHVKKAWNGRIWEPLGFASWNEFCEQTFGSKRIRLAREDRQELVASLAGEGMSNVAIAATTGSSRTTIIKDRAQGVQTEHPVEVDEGTEEGPDGSSEPDPSEWTAEPSPAPTTDDQFVLVDADLDDEIVDAEIVEDVPPEPRKVTGTDGKSYTVTPKPAPTAAELAERENEEADGRYARNIEKVISSWPYLLGTLDSPRRVQILARLSEPDLEQLALIEGMIHEG